MPIEFAIPCHDAGANAIVTFSADDLERLEEHFGANYVSTIFGNLDAMNVVTVKKCLSIGLKGGDLEALMRQAAIAELATMIADALYLRLHGRKISTDDAPAEAGGRVKSQTGADGQTGPHPFPLS